MTAPCRAASVAPKPVVTIVIETPVKSASTTSEATASAVDGNRGQQQHADARAAAEAVDEPDPERRQRAAHLMAPVLVAVPVPDEQPDRQVDDQSGNRRLGAALDALGQVGLEEQDRHAEDDQGHGVPEPPPGAERRCLAPRLFLAGRDERRDRRDVVRVGGVAQAEQNCNEQDDQDRAAARERGDVVVESEHG